jgi:hypothetical protein
VTTSGVFTEYPVPTSDSGPAGIAAGPDGNLWFTEYQGTKVAKVTTSGVFTEYPLPTINRNPWVIATGPDGNLWFTDPAVNRVGKVTTSGVFSEYPVPTANSGPEAIAAGPDGNLWFIENYGLKVAKIVAQVPASPPTITTQPSDQTVAVGATATFTSHASGNPTPTVQWQLSTDGGATFADVGGATADTLSLLNTAVGMSGNQYRAVFNNSLGTATSSAATLTVSPATANSPTVTGVSPAFGPADCGGVRVAIHGTNFTGATSVQFGSTSAVSFEMPSDGVILAIAPAAPAGTVDVTITTPKGTSPKSSADQFTYRSPDSDRRC